MRGIARSGEPIGGCAGVHGVHRGAMTANVDPDAQRLQTAHLAGLIRSGLKGAAFAFCFIIPVALYLRQTFIAMVDPLLLTAWTASMLTIPLTFLLAEGVYILRKPDDAETVRFWLPLSNILLTACNISISAGVWLFMPAADPQLKLVLVVLCLWFAMMQVLASSGDGYSVSTHAGIIGVLGSLIGFFLFEFGPRGVTTSIIIALLGASMLVLRRLVYQATSQATKARAEAEIAAERLRFAVDIIAAERDGKTRFIRSASHDLQQPIQAATLFLDHVLGAENPSERATAATGARAALASTQSLLEHMLDHLRLEAGAVPVRLTSMMLDPIIAAAALNHSPAARDAGMKNIAVPNRLAVIADPELFQRTLNNLIGNAIRHAKGERVLIGARRRAGADVEVWVIDDGEGVATADQGRLFDDFSQGSRADSSNKGGFGLGLSSVRRLVELMGGTVDLDRRWAGGAAFSVRLPAANGGARANAPVTLETPCSVF